MSRINDTTTFPITTPAADDLLIGTDVSDTSSNANGQTVNFRVGDLFDPSALAAGESGQPKIQPAALGNLAILTSAGTATGLERVATVLIFAEIVVAPDGGIDTGIARYRLRTTGGGFGAWVNFMSVTGFDNQPADQSTFQFVTVGPTFDAIELNITTGTGKIGCIAVAGVSP